MPTEPSGEQPARARARLARRLRGGTAAAHALPVFDALGLDRTAAIPAVREIPVAAIAGTIEPGRAWLFDRRFRPAELAAVRRRARRRLNSASELAADVKDDGGSMVGASLERLAIALELRSTSHLLG